MFVLLLLWGCYLFVVIKFHNVNNYANIFSGSNSICFIPCVHLTELYNVKPVPVHCVIRVYFDN